MSVEIPAPAAAANGLLPSFDRPARIATGASLAVASLAVAEQVVVPGAWGLAAWMVLVGGLLLGLPHGAVDHLVPAYRLGWRPLRRGLLALGYAALAAGAYAAFRWAPVAALAVFVVVSTWHFGSGETAFADLRAGRPLRRRWAAASVVGAVVLLIPLTRGLTDPAGDTVALLSRVVPGWSPPSPALLDVLPVLLAMAAAVLGVALLAQRRLLEAGELALLVALALVTPPLAAFGVYFGAWHSLRHVARMVAENPANSADLGDGRITAPLYRFVAAAALPTVAVLGLVAVLWTAADGWRGLVGTYLPLLAALTVPHVLIVSWLDRPGSQAGPRRMGTCGIPSST